MTFGNNITEANCYDYHNDYHYRGAGVCEGAWWMCVVEKSQYETPCNDR